MHPSTCISVSLLLLAGISSAEPTSFYKEPQLFSTAPSKKQSLNELTRFGSLGLALELHQPAFNL